MTPILCEISTVNLQERFFEVLDAIRTIVLEPPVSTPIGHEISRLNSQECHVEMLSAISDIVLASSDFIPLLREIDKLNDQINYFAPQSVDLSPMTRAITSLNSQDTHQSCPTPSETSRSSRQIRDFQTSGSRRSLARSAKKCPHGPLDCSRTSPPRGALSESVVSPVRVREARSEPLDVPQVSHLCQRL